MALLLAALAGPALGCMPTLEIVGKEARAPEVARVTLDGVVSKTLVFMIWNETPLPIVVDRTGITLVTPVGTRRPYGGRRFITVPPGGVRDLKIRFDYDFAGLNNGDELSVDFGSAIVSGGRPVRVEPTLRVRVPD